MDLLEFFFSSLRHIHMYINIYVYTYVYVYIYICKPLNWSWMFFVLFIIICKHDGRIRVEVRGQLLVLNDLELWSYWLTIVFLQGWWGEGGQLSWHLCRKNSLELRRWPWSSHVLRISCRLGLAIMGSPALWRAHITKNCAFSFCSLADCSPSPGGNSPWDR